MSNKIIKKEKKRVIQMIYNIKYRKGRKRDEKGTFWYKLWENEWKYGEKTEEIEKAQLKEIKKHS